MSGMRQKTGLGRLGLVLAFVVVTVAVLGRGRVRAEAAELGRVLTDDAMGRILGDAPERWCKKEVSCNTNQSYGSGDCYYCAGNNALKRKICCKVEPPDPSSSMCDYTGTRVCDGTQRYVGTPGGQAGSCGTYQTCANATYLEDCGGDNGDANAVCGTDC
ncbi:MAG: hypothetical protein U0746_22975 [Gemmataceae bacterium]